MYRQPTGNGWLLANHSNRIWDVRGEFTRKVEGIRVGERERTRKLGGTA